MEYQIVSNLKIYGWEINCFDNDILQNGANLTEMVVNKFNVMLCKLYNWDCIPVNFPNLSKTKNKKIPLAQVFFSGGIGALFGHFIGFVYNKPINIIEIYDSLIVILKMF